MDHTQLKNLRTEEIRTKEDINFSIKLSRYYNYVPIQGRKLEKLVNSDWWASAELLSDIVRNPKNGEEEREPVALLILTEVNFRKRANNPLSDLFVECFAHDPWYDEEIAIKWADYRITQAADRIKRVDKVLWYVDENNTTLQVALREMGYKMANYDPLKSTMVFTR